MTDWPVPSCIKDVWATSDGLSGFAVFVSPLNYLLNGNSAKTPHKKTLWKWEATQQNDFETVMKLSNPPVFIAYADYRLLFNMHADASGSGLGAVLY